MKPVEAWAIRAPDGVLMVKTNNDTEEKAWGFVARTPAEQEMRDRGYRCIRVLVTPVQSEEAKRL